MAWSDPFGRGNSIELPMVHMSLNTIDDAESVTIHT